MTNEKAPRFLCVTVYVKNDQNQFLMICSRKYNRWTPPGGKVESHETPDEAALRECLEETGLKVELVGERTPVAGGLMRPYGSQLDQIGPGLEYIDLIYLARPLPNQVLRRCERETSDIGWFDAQEIATFDTFSPILFWSTYFASLASSVSSLKWA